MYTNHPTTYRCKIVSSPLGIGRHSVELTLTCQDKENKLLISRYVLDTLNT